jgi:hypothetical protein
MALEAAKAAVSAPAPSKLVHSAGAALYERAFVLDFLKPGWHCVAFVGTMPGASTVESRLFISDKLPVFSNAEICSTPSGTSVVLSELVQGAGTAFFADVGRLADSMLDKVSLVSLDPAYEVMYSTQETETVYVATASRPDGGSAVLIVCTTQEAAEAACERMEELFPKAIEKELITVDYSEIEVARTGDAESIVDDMMTARIRALLEEEYAGEDEEDEEDDGEEEEEEEEEEKPAPERKKKRAS